MAIIESMEAFAVKKALGYLDKDPETNLPKLADWFEEWTKSRYGGCTCREILEGDPGNKMKRCPELVEEVYQKCVELLSEKGGLP